VKCPIGEASLGCFREKGRLALLLFHQRPLRVFSVIAPSHPTFLAKTANLGIFRQALRALGCEAVGVHNQECATPAGSRAENHSEACERRWQLGLRDLGATQYPPVAGWANGMHHTLSPMRRRKIIFGILALVLFGVLVATLWPEKENLEPVFKGKKLSAWFEDVDAPNEKSFGTQLEAAVQAIGTNGIPFYLEWLSYRPSLPKRIKSELAAQASRWLPFEWSPQDPKIAREFMAGWALEKLDERAAPAIPQLFAYATNFAQGDARSRHIAVTSAAVLVHMGDPAVPAVLSLLTNHSPRVRVFTILSAKECKDPSIVAQIKASLQDPDPQVRRMAAWALNKYGSMGPGNSEPSPRPAKP
jgi:hypothetical protein